MKQGAKMLALFLAAILLTGSLVPGHIRAAELPEPGRTGSLTLVCYDAEARAKESGLEGYVASGAADAVLEERLSGYALEGLEFMYLKVGEVRNCILSGDSIRISEVYLLDSAVMQALGLTAEKADFREEERCFFTAGSINRALSQRLAAAPIALRNTLEQLAAAGGRPMPLTDRRGRSMVSGLEQGLYLVVETAVPQSVSLTADPFFLSLPQYIGDEWLYDLTVYPKNRMSEPQFLKQVAELPEDGGEMSFGKTAGFSAGDSLVYELTTQLQSISSAASYYSELSWEDELPDNFRYVPEETELIWCREGGTEPEAVWTEEDGLYQVTLDTGGEAERMSVQLTAAGLAAVNPSFSGYTAAFRYTVKLSEQELPVLGESGNVNHAVFHWKHSQTDSRGELKSEAKVFSFGIHLIKKLENGGNVEQVGFVLRNVSDDFFLKAEGKEGNYRVTGTADAGEATVFHPGTDGNLFIRGLEEDVYELRETATAPGYSLLREAIRLELRSEVQDAELQRSVTGYVEGQEAAMTEDGASLNALLPLTVFNRRGTELPSTGDDFPFLFTCLGSAGSGCMLLLLLKKRKAYEQA